MKKFLLALFILPALVQAKRTNLYISLSEFMTDQRENYIEIYFGIHNNSLDYLKNEQGKFLGGLETTIAIYKDSNIVAADRFRIMSPAYADTSNLNELLYHQQRFLLDKGKYRLSITIQDINDTAESYSIERPLQLTVSKDFSDHSQVIFLEDFKPAGLETNNAYTRSGFTLYPIISTGTPFLPESLNHLSFYNELYNLDLSLGESKDFVLRYFLEDDNTGKALNKYGGFSRKKAAPVIPILTKLNIEDLPTGNYQLVIEALNAKGESVLKHKTFFYRRNASNEVLAGSFEQRQITGTFVDRLGNLDSIYQFVDYLYPISTERERIIQENLLAEANEMRLKQYFYAFWMERKPLAPEETWQEYHKQVRIANQLFTSGLRKGYKSDRGRIWLMYGKPDQVDRRDMEPNMPPYIIWQYNNIATPYTVPQNNKIFIFGEFEPSTREFQLIHSTAIGELQSRDWRRDLYYRAYGGAGSIDPDSDSGEREFGNRSNQNIILGTTGSDRINR